VAGLGFSLVKEGARIYKLPLMGFCKLKVQLNYGPQRFRQKERQQWKNIKREERFIKIPKGEVVQNKYLSL
jgi:hypothetical protein